MPRKRKRKGYNKRSRSEHPGVSIQIRNGVAVLRYDLPNTLSRNGRPMQKQQIVRDRDTKVRLTSREAAKPYAIDLARKLAAQRLAEENENVVVRGDMTWEEFEAAHINALTVQGRAAKTLRNYKYVHRLVNEWRGRPNRPADLRQRDLVNFVQYLRLRNESYADASLAAIVRQFKALLNYGRSSDDRCIRIDEVAVRKGLAIGQIRRPMPVALSTEQLRTILEKAEDYDREHARHPIFPLMAFYMLTGVRRAEAARLRWKPSSPGAFESWCDLEGNRLLISSEKTGIQRAVSLRHRKKLKEKLEAMRIAIDSDEKPFVFGGEFELAFGDRNDSKGEEDRGRNMKWPLAQLKELTGVNFRVKDFRSTHATYAANSAVFSNLYVLAGELGHDYAILVKHYANRRELNPVQYNAEDIADIMGIGDLVEAWTTRSVEAIQQGEAPILNMQGVVNDNQGAA